MDVTDMVDYNLALNHPHRTAAFFHLDRNDPTVGFACDATTVSGHTYPPRLTASGPGLTDPGDGELYQRLALASHLAEYLRHQLEAAKGFTSTVGISTNKLIAKLVGNLNKPNGQTTLIPPYTASRPGSEGSPTRFIDEHEIGKIPGIGFKSAQKLREHVLGRPVELDAGLVYGGTKERVLVKDVRQHPGTSGEFLEQLLGGPGAPRGIGRRIWDLIHGVDDSEVSKAKNVPQQISIVSRLAADAADGSGAEPLR